MEIIMWWLASFVFILNVEQIVMVNETHIGKNGPCMCVPYYMCGEAALQTDGLGLLDIRVDIDNLCESYLEVCCPITQNPSTCGRYHKNGTQASLNAKVNDRQAKYGEFPWMAAILNRKNGDNVYRCGGSLINSQVVLTTAHCVKGESLVVQVGRWDVSKTKAELTYQERNVKMNITHTEYKESVLYNNIALLILESPVEINEHVSTICLPEQDVLITNLTCYATGWGKDRFGKEGKYQTILKKIDLPIVPNENCQNILRKGRVGPYFELHNSFICAGGEEGKDMCFGDEGSPLVCAFPDQEEIYQQAGIVSWGVKCADAGVPGVYTSTAKFRKWIDQEMTKLNFDVFSYNALDIK